jgi:hypothetical protein
VYYGYIFPDVLPYIFVIVSPVYYGYIFPDVLPYIFVIVSTVYYGYIFPDVLPYIFVTPNLLIATPYLNGIIFSFVMLLIVTP